MQLFGQLMLTALVTTAAYSLVTVGFSMIFAVARVFHFAHAGLILVPGYVYYAAADTLGVWFALVVALLSGAVAGVLVEDGVYRTLRARSASRMTLLVASLGVMSLLQGAVGAIWGTQPAYLKSPVSSGAFDLGGVRLTVLDLTVVVVAVVAVGALLLWIRHTQQGRAMLAVAEEPAVAATVGISTGRTMRIATSVGTALGGLATLYLGIRSGITPALGDLPLMFAFAGAVVGGLGRIGGSVLGLALLVLISTVATHWVATFWTLPIAFVVLVFFLFLRPEGLLGMPKRSTAL